VYSVHRYTLTAAGLTAEKDSGPPTTRPSLGHDRMAWQRQRALPLPDGGHVEYLVQTPDPSTVGPLQLWLTRVSGNGVPDEHFQLSPITLWDEDRNVERSDWAAEYVFDRKLYIVGSHAVNSDQTPIVRNSYAPRIRVADRLAIIDLADPMHPKLLSISPLNYRFSAADFLRDAFVDERAGTSFLLQLPDIPGLLPRQRLDVGMTRLEANLTIEGDTICFAESGYVAGFRISDLTDRTARMTRLGVFKPSLLDIVFGGQRYMAFAQLKNGLLYSNESFYNRQLNVNREVLRPSISVIDTRGPHPMRMVGHFASPNVNWVVPLDDGRALVAGNKLWLLGPPPNR